MALLELPCDDRYVRPVAFSARPLSSCSPSRFRVVCVLCFLLLLLLHFLLHECLSLRHQTKNKLFLLVDFVLELGKLVGRVFFGNRRVLVYHLELA